ncbi:hypothetical protein Bca52824_071945 [Brassica carinata]|uniref:Uncharacterized protein n=1 Tax=Brassica carinata TaxID=52824 RepID=A0A8X7Q6Y3_BRACI|nr:hypothetical protein Bca52824_071945 [Brassica carinata]
MLLERLSKDPPSLVDLCVSSLRRFCSTDLYIITAHAYRGFYSSKIRDMGLSKSLMSSGRGFMSSSMVQRT